MIDKWSTIIEGGAGRGTWVLETTEKFIKEAEMPQAWCRMRDVRVGAFSRTRPFLIVYHLDVKDYRMFIGARDFGAHLDVSWFVTLNPSPLKNLLNKYSNPLNMSMQVNVFIQQDLSAFTTVAHHCLKRTLDMTYEELNLDPIGLNTQSKGFLNVW